MVKLMHVVEEWAYTCASAVVPDLSPLQPTKAFLSPRLRVGRVP